MARADEKYSEDIEKKIKKLASGQRLKEKKAGFEDALARSLGKERGLFESTLSDGDRKEIQDSTSKISGIAVAPDEPVDPDLPERPDVFTEKGIAEIVDSYTHQNESVLEKMDPETLDRVLIVINRHVSTGFDSDAEYRELRSGDAPAFGDYSAGRFRKEIKYLI